MDVLSPTDKTRLRRRHRLSLIGGWHLLSLDAPTVAILWTWFIASSVRIRLPWTSVLAMGVAVWMLYAADRLLDARHLIDNPLHTGDLEHRHRFHHRYRLSFLLGILAASIALSILIPRLDPNALHLYLILGALVAGYFILIHATGSAHRLPKEIAVGIFFACAVFIPTIALIPTLRPSLLPAAALFALLCSLNCLFIYSWEHPAANTSASTSHLVTRLALRYLTVIALLALTAGILLAAFDHDIPSQIPAACAISCTALLFIHRYRRRLSSLNLRAAADLALLTPILLLPLSIW